MLLADEPITELTKNKTILQCSSSIITFSFMYTIPIAENNNHKSYFLQLYVLKWNPKTCCYVQKEY